MQLPRMTTGRWMVVVAVATVDLLLIVQTRSHPLAHVAFFGTAAVIILSPVMLLLLMLSAGD